MPKEKMKNWKESQRDRQLRQQRVQESERIRLEFERKYKNGHKGYPKGKIFFAICLIAVILVSIVAWQSSISSSAVSSGTINPSSNTPPTSSSTPSTPASSLQAPNFSLEDVNGTLFSLKQHSGQVIAIHFHGPGRLQCSIVSNK